MFTGLDPDSPNGANVVGRLIAAGVLTHGKAGLETTERWQAEMLRELSVHRHPTIQESLEHTIAQALPGTPLKEVDLMLRIMLFVEARESGWQGA